MNEHQKVSCFNRRKTPIYIFQVQKWRQSTVWFVCWTKWQIWRYDWSDGLSIKLPAKEQMINKDHWESDEAVQQYPALLLEQVHS